jgi:hypothetical protein
MNRLFVVPILLLSAAIVWSEDLGELAKKEKARREALKKQGKKATVLTNQDVPNIKSSLGIESSTLSEESSPDSGETSETAAAVENAIDDSSKQLEELRRQKAELTQEIQTTSESIQQTGPHATNIGEQYKQKRLKEEELKKVESQIQDLEKAKAEENGTDQEN